MKQYQPQAKMAKMMQPQKTSWENDKELVELLKKIGKQSSVISAKADSIDLKSLTNWDGREVTKGQLSLITATTAGNSIAFKILYEKIGKLDGYVLNQLFLGITDVNKAGRA